MAADNPRDYIVRVSIYGQPFQDPDILDDEVPGGPATLVTAWGYKLKFEDEHRDQEGVAEVVNAETGRPVRNPIVSDVHALIACLD